MENSRQKHLTHNIKPKNSVDTVGVWYAVIAYAIWGFLPLYWKLLGIVPALEILSHRIWWSFVFVAVVLTLTRRWGKLKAVLSKPRNLGGIALSGFVLSGNWYTYIWAVNHERVVEASLGYYINPLLTIFLGMIVLKEKLNFWQLTAVLLAAVGVLVQTLEFGQVPWIALTLALSFAIYGLAKKLVNVDSIIGLALETLVVVPIALGYIFMRQSSGIGAVGEVPYLTLIFLIGTGIVTATPLLFFGLASKRVPLSTMGFAQYIAPSISLLLGVFAFKEPFTSVHITSFSFIWGALALYSISGTSFMLAKQPRFFRVREKNA